MEIKKGIAVSPGVAIAPAFLLESEDYRIPERKIRPERADGEVLRFDAAVAAARKEYEELREKAREDAGDLVAGIFNAHSMILSDPAVSGEILKGIREHNRTAEYALSLVMRRYAKIFLGHKNRQFADRVQDIYDIERMLLRHLIGERRENLSNLSTEVVVIAHDLTPSQTAALDRNKVRGFATDAGGRTSHVAILARALGMPAVVGLKNISLEVSGDDTVIIDGHQGIVVIRPDRATLEKYRETEKRLHRTETELSGMRTMPAVTLDGVKITMLGNIEFPHEVDDCLKNGAEGIGLYRTEYLYLGQDKEPTEEDHLRAYSEVVAHMPDKPIVLRTLDLGADKYLPGRTAEHEPNPFLGLRSIRLCLQEPEMFKTQLRAVLRAAAKGNIRIMFPMITTISELRQAKALLGHVMEDLDEEHVPFDRNVKVGMMVEVPAAAYILSDFAREVDFFSVGTNDLIQYTLAVDRGNEAVASLYSPANPAVLRLLKHVVTAADEAKVEISICGEMGGDPDYTLVLLGMGFRVLSVTAPGILEVKKVIRSISIEQAKAVADKVLTLDSDREVISFLKETTRKLLPENF